MATPFDHGFAGARRASFALATMDAAGGVDVQQYPRLFQPMDVSL